MVTTMAWKRLGWVRTASLHRLGDHRRELREALRLREFQPEWIGFLFAEVRARAALGHTEWIEQLVEDEVRSGRDPVGVVNQAMLELNAHGFPETAMAIGERTLVYLDSRPPEVQITRSHRLQAVSMLYLLGRWSEARAVLEPLVREEPDDAYGLHLLGLLAARLERPDEARSIARRVEALKGPYDFGRNEYRRACIAALVGDRDAAVSLLREAYEDGWQGWFGLHNDPDLGSLRGYPPFEEFARPKG
jgi:hypothetical protein